MTPDSPDPLDLLLAEAAQAKKGLPKDKLPEAARLLGEVLRSGNVQRFIEAAEPIEAPAVDAFAESWPELAAETREKFTAALGSVRFQNPKARGFAFRAAARIVKGDPTAALTQVRTLAQSATAKGVRVASGMDAGNFRDAFIESGVLSHLAASGEIAATFRPILMLVVGAAFARSKGGKLPLAVERQAEALNWLLSGGWWKQIPEREQKLILDAIAEWPKEHRDAFMTANATLPFDLPAQKQPAIAATADTPHERIDQPPTPDDFLPMIERLKSLWNSARKGADEAQRREAEREKALRESRVKLAETRTALEGEQARVASLQAELEISKADAKTAREEAARLVAELAPAQSEIARLRELIPIERQRAVDAKLDEMARDLAANYRDFLSGEGHAMTVDDGIALQRHCRNLYERLRRHGLNLQ